MKFSLGTARNRRTEPQEPPEKPNRMNLNRCFKTATEPNRTITFMHRGVRFRGLKGWNDVYSRTICFSLPGSITIGHNRLPGCQFSKHTQSLKSSRFFIVKTLLPISADCDVDTFRWFETKGLSKHQASSRANAGSSSCKLSLNP